MRDTFTRCLEAYAETHPELVLVTGDLGFGVLFPYMKKFPDRFINAGISEQAMMSMAAGMALTEDVGHDKRTGGLKNLNFENYLIPTAMDVNDNVPLLDEHYDNRTAFGGHSIGEPATEPGAAAVICAVNHALGKAGLIHELPADLDRVFFAARSREAEKGEQA